LEEIIVSLKEEIRGLQQQLNKSATAQLSHKDQLDAAVKSLERELAQQVALNKRNVDEVGN
jgi:hypothetical protein